MENKNWILICCRGRDIEKPIFFKTKDEARSKMCKEVADTVGADKSEVFESYLKGTKYNDYCIVGEDYAFCDLNEPIDWKIYNIGVSIL